MENLYAVCCGIDVHKKLIVACLRKGSKTEVRSYGACTSDLMSLADWLTDNNCEAVAMESTASYWKPVYNILEASDLHPIVVNAQHMKQVPGRKTDVKDAEWISDLLAHGLLTPSYIPSRAQRELRELVSYRKSLVKTKGAELNRLQKMLEGANIKLSGTVSDINGKSANALLDYILSGNKFTEASYDELLKSKRITKRLKATKRQLVEDLNGFLSPVQIKMMQELRTHIQELDHHIAELDQDINEHMNDEEKKAAEWIQQIPGIGDDSSKIIISVIGTDMSRFPTGKNLASWAGLCPGNHESAGKKKSGRTTKGNKLLRTTLVVCAHSAVQKKDSYFYSLYCRISAHRGKKRAIVAVAHAMLIIIYNMLKTGEAYEELGADYHEQKNKEGRIQSYVKKLQHLGIEIPAEVLNNRSVEPAPAI